MTIDNEYNRIYSDLIRNNQSENDAQRNAIAQTFINFMGAQAADAALTWKSLNSAHIQRKAGIKLDLTPAQIDAVVSAHQSWNKSSGHAAEALFKIRGNQLLEPRGIKIFLQKDISTIINNQESQRSRRGVNRTVKREIIANKNKDVMLIKEWNAKSVFDLYIGGFIDDEEDTRQITIFGCIQSKASIRDRVTRDREPSIQSMNAFFWSVALVIDGAFLEMDKFKSMVNGGSTEYPSNGWHGMYSLSTNTENNRIYPLNWYFSPFVEHAEQARDKFNNERQWFDSEWKAE